MWLGDDQSGQACIRLGTLQFPVGLIQISVVHCVAEQCVFVVSDMNQFWWHRWFNDQFPAHQLNISAAKLQVVRFRAAFVLARQAGPHMRLASLSIQGTRKGVGSATRNRHWTCATDLHSQ